jgi:transposase InsO family protein
VFDGAQVALQQSPILRPNKLILPRRSHRKNVKELHRTFLLTKSGHFARDFNDFSFRYLISLLTTFYVGVLKGVGRVYLHAVVDTYGSYAFGFLHTTKQPEAAVAVVHNDVLPFYEERGLPVDAILTDNGREFCGKDTHPYELYLELNDIEHRKTQVRRPQTNGFVERFNRTVLDEFFRIVFRTKLYESVEVLQLDLDAWLVHYNTERPHQGYRNQGRRPIETIELFSAQGVRNES